MRKRIAAVFLAAIIAVFTSCGAVVVNEADEIRLNSWSARLKSGSRVTLSFDGDRADFTVKSDDRDARLRLSGLCFFDSEKFALYDEKDKSEYIFRYRLRDNKLTLLYDEGKITLKRR